MEDFTYIWHVNNVHHRNAETMPSYGPLFGPMQPSDSSMLIPSWEAFEKASK